MSNVRRHANIPMSRPPKSLLRDVCWSFSEPVPHSPAELIKAARDYAAEIETQDPRNDLVQTLPFSDVRIKYAHAVRAPGGEWHEREAEVRVVGTQHARLTGADLLWELHVACASAVGNDDHHFFEGFELVGEGKGGEPPTYRVSLGS